MSIIGGFFRTLLLFITGMVHFIKEDVGKEFIAPDGMRFIIFRHVIILRKSLGIPCVLFTVRFQLKNMCASRNISFSKIPMMVLIGFKGFCSKYWMFDEETGICQGVYEWQTEKDAENYAKSIAMRFMKGRSVEGSVSYSIKNI
jgi:hypothetical protein